MAKKKFKGFSDEERAAMRERSLELKAEARSNKNRTEGEKTLLAALAALSKADRMIGERLHEIVTASAPKLMPKTWYGMPAYANSDDKVICFFQAASKFKVRYSTFGFQPDAKLDDGNMWPTAFALKKLTPEGEKKIAALVKRAIK